jgi:hypothetical protein
MKPESKISDSYGNAAAVVTTPGTSEEVVQLLTAILRRVKDEPFLHTHTPPLGPEALAAARAYDRLCSSLDHETPVRSGTNLTRK